MLLLDLESLEDRIKEAGGEEELVFLICAQVAGGCSLTDWCGHYGIERGLVWAFLSETPERMARYDRALRGIADDLYSQMAGIADTPQMGEIRKIKADGSEEVTQEDMLGHRKLRIDTYAKVAAKYDRARFGESSNVQLTGAGGKDLAAPVDVTTVARRVAFLLRKGVEAEDVSDAVVVENPPQETGLTGVIDQPAEPANVGNRTDII